MWTTHDGPAVINAKARHWSKITIFAPVRGSPSNTAIMFGMKTLEWCGYPTGKNYEDMLFVST